MNLVNHNKEKDNGKKRMSLKLKIKSQEVKTNTIRTKLLLHIDEDNSLYLKNSSFKLNSRLPKEIVEKYFESFTVTFNNPMVLSNGIGNNGIGQAKVGQMTKKTVLPIKLGQGEGEGEGEVTIEPSNPYTTPNNINNANFKSNKSVGIFYYSKYIKEIGKEFIDQRKLGVGSKKIEKDFILNNNANNLLGNNLQVNNVKNPLLVNNFSYKRPGKNIQIDTELSFIETINQLNLHSAKNRSSNCSTSKRLTAKEGVFKFPRDKEEIFKKIFQSKQDQEAGNIQSNFNRLQDMVGKLKKMDDFEEDPSEDYYLMSNDRLNLKEANYKCDVEIGGSYLPSNNNSNGNFFKNFKKNFNEELFNILEYKGVKFDSKTLNDKAEFNDREVLTSRNENYVSRNIFSSIYDRKNEKNEKFEKIEKNEKYEKNNLIENAKEDKYFNFSSARESSNKLPLNLNTAYRSHRNNIKLDILNDECTNASPLEEYRDEESVTTPLSIDKLASNFFSHHNFIENFSDIEANEINNEINDINDITEMNETNEIELRMSNISTADLCYKNQAERPIQNVFKQGKGRTFNSSDNIILKLVKCNNTGTVVNDSIVSKCSGSEYSKYSNVSKNKSDNTMSYISEFSDDFTGKNIY